MKSFNTNINYFDGQIDVNDIFFSLAYKSGDLSLFSQPKTNKK